MKLQSTTIIAVLALIAVQVVTSQDMMTSYDAAPPDEFDGDACPDHQPIVPHEQPDCGDHPVTMNAPPPSPVHLDDDCVQGPSPLPPTQSFGEPHFQHPYIPVIMINQPAPNFAPAQSTVSAYPNQYPTPVDDDGPSLTTAMGVQIKVKIIVDDAFSLYFNGRTTEWVDQGWERMKEYTYDNVVSGDVLAIHAKDKDGLAGILVNIEFMSNGQVVEKHVDAEGWTCTRHHPKEDSWMLKTFSNAGDNFGWMRRFEKAKKHGKRGAWPWLARGDVSNFDEESQWFWTEHNFWVNEVWCRLSLDPSFADN